MKTKACSDKAINHAKSLEPEHGFSGYLRLETAVYQAIALIELLSHRLYHEINATATADSHLVLASNGMVVMGDTISDELQKAWESICVEREEANRLAHHPTGQGRAAA